MGCLTSIFTTRINSELFPWAVCHVQEWYLPKCLASSDVQYCVNQYAVVRPSGLTWKKSRPALETENENMADNADITQSQARDTTHRLMQEVNSLCTDSGLLRA